MEKYIVLEQSHSRQMSELCNLQEKLQIIKRSGNYPRIEKSMVEMREGLINHKQEYISPRILKNDPINSVQIFPDDQNSPFGERVIIGNFWQDQSIRRQGPICNPETPIEFCDQNESSQEQMRIANLILFFELCDEQANAGRLVTYTSGDTNFSSIMQPLHVQSIKLKDGIKIWQGYEESKLIYIHDLPDLIKRTNERGLVFNMRFVGKEMVIINGTFVSGYEHGKLPITPKKVNSRDNNIIQTLAIQPGAVESFTSNVIVYKPMISRWLKHNNFPHPKTHKEYINFYRNRSVQLGYKELMN
jgi:hypothetical protein